MGVKRGRKQGTGLGVGVAAQKQVLRRYKENAKVRGILMLLTDDQLTFLFKQPCYYCGVAPNATVKQPGLDGNFLHNGIDRIDNSLPYTIENAVACCSFCNHAKYTHTEEEFREWVRRTYEYMFL